MRFFWRFYTSLRGRTARRFFWLFGFVPFIVIGFALGLIDGGKPGVPVSTIVVFLLLLWPQVAILVRRLHDIGLSGLWLISTAIPYVFLLAHQPTPAFIGQCVVFLAVLILGVVPGNGGENRFGPTQGKLTA
jgi:uncharacterized membrane protein YhaH (DUF805 family)